MHWITNQNTWVVHVSFFGHLRKCRSRMQRKWITATTGLMVVQRISSYCPSSGGDLLGDLSTMFDDLSGSNWPTAFWSWGGPWRRMIMMTAKVLLMGSSMTTCCSRSGRTWSSTSLLFVIICSNLHCVRDCWRPTRYGHSSRNCGWDCYRNCWSSTWCHCQSCCWLRQSFGWPKWRWVHVAGNWDGMLFSTWHPVRSLVWKTWILLKSKSKIICDERKRTQELSMVPFVGHFSKCRSRMQPDWIAARIDRACNQTELRQKF